jgi:hypothetical protein
MMQIIEQTYEEKMAMYMKCTKKELAEMLINCNDILSMQMKLQSTPTATVNNFCNHEMEWTHNSSTGGFYRCKKCGLVSYPSTITYGTYFQS